VKDLIRLAVDKICSTLGLKEFSVICLIVNNLGLVSHIELGALAKYTKEYFGMYKIIYIFCLFLSLMFKK